MILDSSLPLVLCCFVAQDPILSVPTVVTSDAASDAGRSVASAGDVNGDGYSDVLVAEPSYSGGAGLSTEGRALLYLGGPSGLAGTPAWSFVSGQEMALLGYTAVASAGDVNGDGYSDVIVGAMVYDNGQSDEGRAYIFMGSASGLAASPAWVTESNYAGADYGRAVACAGDVNGDGYSDVIVGAPGFKATASNRGRAYVYYGSASGLATAPAWTADGANFASYLGFSAAGAGDVNGDGYDDVIVGSRSDTNDSGRASLYLGSTSGPASVPDWTVSGTQYLEQRGFAVAGAGDVNGDGYSDVIVGAVGFTNGQLYEGGAFVYLGSASGLATSPAWSAEGNQGGGVNGFTYRFGHSVAGVGDLNGDGFGDIAVGFPEFDVDPDTSLNTNEGKVFVYLGSPSGPETTPVWTAQGAGHTTLGECVSGAGDTDGDGYAELLVGLKDTAQLYSGSAAALAQAEDWTSDLDCNDFSAVGAALASAGDVNGDGYSDVIVAAPDSDSTAFQEGRVALFLGSATSLATTPAWTIDGQQTDAQLGRSVAGAGDVNGDGYDDVLVGVPGYSNGQSKEGRALLYEGSASGLVPTIAWSLEGEQADATLGASVAGASDVNGDGFADVLIGAPEFDDGQTGEGRVQLFLGGPTGLRHQPLWEIEGAQSSAHLGRRVASAGDVNGDGLGDVVLCANAAPRVRLFTGRHGPLASTPSWTGDAQWAVTAGDVNGDGFSDLLTGDPFAGSFKQGRADVYLGSASGLATTAAWSIVGSAGLDVVGSSVTAAGDVNGDGFSDVAVGAGPGGNVSEVRLYLGSASGLSTTPAWIRTGASSMDLFGAALATAGDVDGDGFGDLLVGATAVDGVQDAVGLAYLFRGNEGRGGWTRAPQQVRTRSVTPIALFGRADDANQFRLELDSPRPSAGLAHLAPGARRARLEWQVARLDQPLSTAIQLGPWRSWTPTLHFAELADFATPGQLPFHWRARVRTNSPLFPVTPWTWLPWNAVTEAKLRRGASTTAEILTPIPAPAGRTRP